MNLVYLGTHTLVFKKEDTTLVVDPHFTRPGLFQLFRLRSDPSRVAQGLRKAAINRVAAVLLTHTHYDHALDLPVVIQLAGGVAYGSESARQILLGAGLAGDCFHPVQVGQAIRVGPFSVRFHPARHIQFPLPLSWLLPETGRITTPLKPPAAFWAYRCGEVFAIQVDRTLIFGSAGFAPGAYADLDLETVILGIGGLEAMPSHYLRQLYHETVLATGASHVWLSHWDNFFRPVNRELKRLAFSGLTVRRIKALGDGHGQMVAQLPFNKWVYM
jgi:hypothetical protein